jgi:hypothetical protein
MRNQWTVGNIIGVVLIWIAAAAFLAWMWYAPPIYYPLG